MNASNSSSQFLMHVDFWKDYKDLGYYVQNFRKWKQIEKYNLFSPVCA